MSSIFFNTDAESAILGIILHNKDIYYTLNSLKSYMFSSQQNEALFIIIEDLVVSGLEPTPELLTARLASKGSTDSVGGIDYINHIYSSTMPGSEANVREFERIVVDAYKSRRLVSLSVKVSNKVQEADDINILIDEYRRELDSLDEEATLGVMDFHSLLKSSWDLICDRVANPGIQGISTGIKSIDAATYGMGGNELWVISGRPGMGKSAFMSSLALNQAKSGVPVMIFSLEMSENLIIERILSSVTGIPITKFRTGTLSQSELDISSNTIRDIKNYPLFVDAKYNASVVEIIGRIRKYHKMHGIKIVYVDYLQLLAKRDSNATQEIGQICRELKLIARELDITIVIGSQLNRSVEMRDDKRPILHDLRQSGNIEEDADCVIGLYRDEQYNSSTKDRGVVECLLLKQRSGPTGVVYAKFNAETCNMYGG